MFSPGRVCVYAIGVLAALAPVHGFIGLGIKMYEPSCAYACRSVIAGAMLECVASDDDHSDHAMMKRHGHGSSVTPECRSTSQAFLSTLAYCIDQRCYHDDTITAIPTKSRIEWYFAVETTGDKALPPMWSFAEALQSVTATPNTTYDSADMELGSTMLVDEEAWYAERLSLETFRDRERMHSIYSVSIVVIGAAVPIILFLGQHLPYGTWLRRWLGPRYIYQSIFRGHVVKPIKRVFLFPTLGQSWYIGLMVTLTLLFSFIDVAPVLPNTWFRDRTEQATALIANRTGAISMALMPLTILFAGRNNILLYVTGWSHGTYLLFHRWIGRLCVLEALIHSIAELRMYVLKGTLFTEQQELYWIWGSVATVAGVVILLAAIPRRYYYEIFLITHILLAVFFLAGTWYHIIYLFEFDWGYEKWIYACSAVWFFDRVIRLWRTAKNGIRSTVITPVGNELVRIDIPGVRWTEDPGQHAYVFLPALRKWAPWENHPFSVVPSALLRTSRVLSMADRTPIPDSAHTTGASRTSTSADSDEISPVRKESAGSDADLEKSLPVVDRLPRRRKADEVDVDNGTGITIFTRKQGGITTRLFELSPSRSVTALLEGPYKSFHHSPILQVDRLIVIAGGIGVTAVLPFVPHHRNVSFHWGMREAQRDAIEHLQPAYEHLASDDRNVVVGKRLDIGRIIENEVRDGWSLIGVLVCGPGGMCDDVRKEVVRLGSITATRFELQVEAFAW